MMREIMGVAADNVAALLHLLICPTVLISPCITSGVPCG